MKKYILAITSLLVLGSLHAQPPKPELGTRWMLNEQFSDEFNGSELDLGKWYNYHPSWQGRPPARFEESMVSVEDGLLVLRNQNIEGASETDYWRIHGAAVCSRTQDAHFGYYECSQKASKIRMSSTFWMSNGSAAGPDPCSADRYSQELDIQEGIGGHSGDFKDHMHSNTHYWYTDCDGNKLDKSFSSGNQIKLEEGLISDTFHVYAANWKNSKSVDFYLNGKFGGAVTIRQDVDDTPFERPMRINMVTETYDWVSPPTTEDLDDDSRNTTYIDYVRAWKLVEVDYSEGHEGNEVQNGGFESGDFSNWTSWGGDPLEVVSDQVHSGSYAAHIGGPGAPEYVINLRSYATYTLSCYGKIAPGSDPILFGIKQADETVLGSVQLTSTEYQKYSFTFTTGSSGISSKFYFYAPKAGDEGWADDFELYLEDGQAEEVVETPIFDENISFSERPAILPTNLPLEIAALYQCNGMREIILQLRDADSILVKEKTFPAYAGYGHKSLRMDLDAGTLPGEYILSSEIRHADSTLSDPKRCDSFHLFLEDPVNVQVKALDIRDGSPLEGVSVRIREEEKLTGSDGMALYEDLAAGNVSLSLEKEGYDPMLRSGIWASRDTLFECFMAPLSYRVEVQVADAHSGDRIRGATISLGDSILASDLQGLAIFSAFAGSFDLEASVERYHPVSHSVTVEGTEVFALELTRALADVKFVVKKDDSYLKDALVSIDGQEALSSSIGLVHFSDLATGQEHAYTISESGTLLWEDRLVAVHDTTVRLNINTTIHVPEGKEASLKVYPNPASGILWVEGLEESSPCRILAMDGRLVREAFLEPGGNLDLAGLQKGMYLLQIGQEHRFRFVKQD